MFLTRLRVRPGSPTENDKSHVRPDSSSGQNQTEADMKLTMAMPEEDKFSQQLQFNI